MRSIEKVIDIIIESNYFYAWRSVLLSDNRVNEWKLLLEHSSSDEFFRYYEDYFVDQHRVKNRVAQAYLKKKLKYDSELIETDINKKLSSTLETKRDLINAHLRWMQAFIITIIDKPQNLELDATRCHVGRWLMDEGLTATDSKINELH